MLRMLTSHLEKILCDTNASSGFLNFSFVETEALKYFVPKQLKCIANSHFFKCVWLQLTLGDAWHSLECDTT